MTKKKNVPATDPDGHRNALVIIQTLRFVMFSITIYVYNDYGEFILRYMKKKTKSQCRFVRQFISNRLRSMENNHLAAYQRRIRAIEIYSSRVFSIFYPASVQQTAFVCNDYDHNNLVRSVFVLVPGTMERFFVPKTIFMLYNVNFKQVNTVNRIHLHSFGARSF